MAVLYYANQYFSTTLNVGGGIDDTQTTGIVLQSVSGVTDITKPGVCCITYADPIVTSTAEWITYTSINGSNELVGVTRGADGYGAKTHSNGATIAFPISRSHINNINDKLTGVDAVLVTDEDGNEIIKTANVESAVNEITVTNAITATNPIVEATGGDTKIAVHFKGKAAFNKHTGLYDCGTVGATETVNWINGDRQLLTMDENLTITFSNPVEGQTITLYMLEDGTGTNTITFADTIVWADATTPTWTTTANKMNIAVISYVGATYYGVANKFA